MQTTNYYYLKDYTVERSARFEKFVEIDEKGETKKITLTSGLIKSCALQISGLVEMKKICYFWQTNLGSMESNGQKYYFELTAETNQATLKSNRKPLFLFNGKKK